MRITETPLFAALKANNEVAAEPVSETIRLHWRLLLLIAGTRITENASFYLFAIASIVYGRDVLHLKDGVILLGVIVGASAEFLTIPLFGMLSDRLTRRAMYVTGCLFLIVFAFPFYAMLHTGETGWIVLAIVLGMAAVTPCSTACRRRSSRNCSARACAARERRSVTSWPSRFPAAWPPLIAVALSEWLPGQYWPLAAYIIFNSVDFIGVRAGVGGDFQERHQRVILFSRDAQRSAEERAPLRVAAKLFREYFPAR